MKKTNFDQYLGERLKDAEFAERFERAGEAWDVALQLTALRPEAELRKANSQIGSEELLTAEQALRIQLYSEG